MVHIQRGELYFEEEEEVDISLDHNLEQVVNIPTQGENISDLMFPNNGSGLNMLNKVSALPSLGKARDIIYAEVDISVHRPYKPVTKVFLYRKVKWDD